MFRAAASRMMLAGGRPHGLASTQGLGTTVTVRAYVQEVLEKLDAHSRIEALVNADRLGLIRLGV